MPLPLILAALLSLTTTLPSPGPAVAEPQIQVSPRVVNLGSVGHYEKHVVAFEVTNSGSQPLAIAKVKASCDCMTVEFGRTPLAPGETRKGQVRIKMGRGFGRFDKHVDIHAAGATRPAMIRVLAQFHPGIKSSANQVFVEGSPDKTLPQSRVSVDIQRSSTNKKPLELTDLVTDSPLLLASREQISPTHHRLWVEISADYPVGRVKGQLSCRVEGRALVIPITGQVHRGVRVHPDYFNFSRIDQPRTAREEVWLESLDGQDFQVLEVVVEPQRKLAPDVGIEVEVKVSEGQRVCLVAKPVPLAPGSGFPKKQARLSGVVRVKTSHPVVPVIRLRYFGVLPGPAKKKAPTPGRSGERS